jgi:hypothetical protein
MNSHFGPVTSRRAFLGSASSAAVLLAFARANPVFAASSPAGAATAPLPMNFANPPGSPIDAILKDIPLPRLVPIETAFDRPVLADVAQTFRAKLHASRVLESIRPESPWRSAQAAGASPTCPW